jgi:TonB family protein
MIVMVGLVGCAGSRAGRPGSLTTEECGAKVAAEKELAAKEGRSPEPLVQRGQRLTNILDQENRARISPDMTKDAKDQLLFMVARIFVNAEGGVSDVQVETSSGVKAFDGAVVETMKAWKHQPKMVDCAPTAYDYPLRYEHRTVQ